MTLVQPHPWSNPQDDDDVAEVNLGDPRDMTLPAPRAKAMTVKDELVWAQRVDSLGDKATAEKLRELGMPKAGLDAYLQHREDTRVAEQWAIRAEWLAYREGKTIEQAMSSLTVALGPLTINQSAVLKAHWVYGERHADWVCQLQSLKAVKGELKAAQPDAQSLPPSASLPEGKPLVSITRPDGKRVRAEIEASWRLPEAKNPCWMNARHNGKLESYYWNGGWFFNEPEPWSDKDVRHGGMIQVYPTVEKLDPATFKTGDYLLVAGEWYRLGEYDYKGGPKACVFRNSVHVLIELAAVTSHRPCPRILIEGKETPVERMWESGGLAWVNVAGSGWYRPYGTWLPFGRRYTEAPRGGDANGFIGDNFTEQRTWPPLDIEPLHQPAGGDLII